jgi:hypothetical protein
MKKTKPKVQAEPKQQPIIREITAAILDSIVGGNSIRARCNNFTA